ncbi:MAG: glycosyltransferase [Planctomycetota bacterium]
MTTDLRRLRTLAVVTTTCYPDPRVRAVRWSQLARALPSFGWRVVLLSRYYGSAATRDEIDRDVHPSAEIHYIDRPAERQPAPGRRIGPPAKNSRRRRLLGKAAALLYPPDASARSWLRMRPRILEALKEVRPDAVVAGFPTGGNIALVPWLSEHQSAPVVADFEDPFTIDARFRPRGLSRLRAGAYAALEREVHQRASLILHAIPIHHRWARLAYPFARDRCRELMMSVPETMVDSTVVPDPDPEGLPSVRVVGAMDGSDMLLLARAVAQIIESGERMRLDLVGTAPETASQIRQLLGDHARIHGRVAHGRALSFIAGASVLVNMLSSTRRLSLGLSSKLFECVASGNPVVEVNPTRSDRLFVRTLPGVTTLVDPTEAELASVVRSALASRSEQQSAIMRDAIRHETWSERAAQLAGWLDDTVEGSRVRP